MTDVLHSKLDALEKAIDVQRIEVEKLRDALMDTLGKLDAIMAQAEPHIATAGKMLEDMQSHPMAKMFGIGGKK